MRAVPLQSQRPPIFTLGIDHAVQVFSVFLNKAILAGLPILLLCTGGKDSYSQSIERKFNNGFLLNSFQTDLF